LRPAFPSVRSSRVIKAALPAPGEKDDRRLVRPVSRDLVLDVHVPGHELSIGRVLIFPADEKISLFLDLERWRGIGSESGVGQDEACNEERETFHVSP
jgi:hypothetical protein